MVDALLYEAGLHSQALRFSLTLDRWKKGMTPLQIDMLVRYLEIWCDQNCEGDWKVRETERFVTIQFAASRDIILFQFSEDYAYFEDQEIVETPQVAA